MSPVHWETQGMFGPLAVVYNSVLDQAAPLIPHWTKRCCNVPDLVDCGVIIPDFMGYTQRYAVFRRGFEPVDEVVEKVNEWKAALQDTTSAESENVPALHTTPRARSEECTYPACVLPVYLPSPVRIHLPVCLHPLKASSPYTWKSIS
ncbi:hypothetical protein DL89DRAFT_264160 [Linderina pennispora]|uniref:Uncharacterized protein n=1 Tax=Linderina pennispora TaxID=61395 RepID=A0A1Y1WLP9_9FUNG|nr:uncharacterized protein DL89DRAFT_264160 [Linderina pennispora]ORX74228.1 hypothetical protein DL89DRAFT_264160 [Linderina pennispora]